MQIEHTIKIGECRNPECGNLHIIISHKDMAEPFVLVISPVNALRFADAIVEHLQGGDSARPH